MDNLTRPPESRSIPSTIFWWPIGAIHAYRWACTWDPPATVFVSRSTFQDVSELIVRVHVMNRWLTFQFLVGWSCRSLIDTDPFCSRSTARTIRFTVRRVWRWLQMVTSSSPTPETIVSNFSSITTGSPVFRKSTKRFQIRPSLSLFPCSLLLVHEKVMINSLSTDNGTGIGTWYNLFITC